VKTALALLLLTSVAHAKPTIATVDETLGNGLHVIVAPDATVNSIVVYVRYGGGFTEDPNTVLLDHVFAMWTEVEYIDGYSVSNFEAHHTDVFDVVPAGALELALWQQARRMAEPTASIREIQLRVATQDALADYDAAYVGDSPYAVLDLAIDKLLWPGRGARRGTPERLGATTLEQLRSLARTRLVPANATLVIAGRIEPHKALALVHRYFDAIPKKNGPKLTTETAARPDTHWAEVKGLASSDVVVVPIRDALPLTLVVERLLTSHGLDVELRELEELRITSRDSPVALETLPTVIASDDEVRAARMAAEAKLLLELESLPHRARLLAAGVDLDDLRKRIAAVTTDDVRQFTSSVSDTAIEIKVHGP
jgi:predicted Zn-dependent peptidase